MFDRIENLEIEFRCVDGPETEWKVTGCHVDEAIDQPYRAVLELSSSLSFKARDLLGGDGELVFSRGPMETRRVYGVVTRVEELGYSDHRQRISVELVPAFALLDQGQNSRIFQDKSVQDIVSEVLDEGLGAYGRGIELGSIVRGSVARDYCVQYRESDYDFVCRLLEEEGIAWAFVHEADTGVEALHLHDASDQYRALENVDGSGDLPVIASAADEADLESAQGVAWISQLAPTSSLRRDYDWLTPTAPLSELAGEADARGRERRVYTHVRRRYIEDDLAERVADRVESESREDQLLGGVSNASVLAPGLRFNLTHTTPELEGEYLVTRVSHELLPADGDAPTYHNRFECIPVDVPWRPRVVTPKPRVHGPQTAIVVGDDEIHTDEHGRIQVQFHWEEEPSYATGASCWVRCAQSWAGPGWGAQFIPRVGMEVVVEFLEGNPDRPLVTGCVYNGDHLTPFVLPDNKTQSGWRTASSPGEGGYNMIRFEDAAGSEEIHVHGQKDWTIVIENDKTEEILHDQSLDVTNDRSKHVGHDEKSTIDNDRSIAVGKNHDETIGVDMTLNVGSNRTMTVASNLMETIGVSATQVVGAAKTVTVGGANTVTVGGAFTVGVGAGMATTVAGSSALGISGSASQSVGGSSSESVKGDKTLTAETITQTAKTDMSVSVKKKLNISSGDDMSIVGGKSAIFDVEDKLVLKCGDASITLEKSGDIKIKGAKIQVKGSGEVKIKGSKVGNN